MSNLAIDYNQIRRELGRKLGIRDVDAWDAQERQDFEDIIKSGLRRFYWHAVVRGPDGKPYPEPHSWSFLRPVRELALEASRSTYDLPEDFGELIEPVFTWAAGASQAPIAVVPEQQIRALASQSAQTGSPKYAAIRVKEQAPGGTMRHEVVFYPTPTAVATLTYRSSISPPDLTDANPHPLGGAHHGETILESCLAAAEKTLNDQDGIHEKRYLECLAASVERDKKLLRTGDDGIWPLENAATDLTITKAYLKRLIGRQLGYGPHFATWTHKASQEINLALETGLRKFYAPAVLPGERSVHHWSFLKPILDLVTVAGEHRYAMPADFQSIDGPINYLPESAVLYPPITEIGEHQLRYYLQRQEASSRPLYAAVSLLDISIGVTAYELLFWPVPDAAYRLRFRYSANPIMLGEETALPFGGQFHGQTVIEACLAAAELQVGLADGPHAAEFARCLLASVAHDRKVSAPESMGYNADRSDRLRDWWVNHHDLDENLVTYTGYFPDA